MSTGSAVKAERLSDEDWSELAPGQVDDERVKSLIEQVVAEVLSGTRADRALKRILRSNRDLDSEERRRVALWSLGVVLWHGRLSQISADLRLWLSLYLLDVLKVPPETAAALGGLQELGGSDCSAGTGMSSSSGLLSAPNCSRLPSSHSSHVLSDLLSSVVEPEDAAESLVFRRSLPLWLAKRWIKQFGEKKADSLAAAMNSRGPISLRANVARISPEELARRLRLEGVEVQRSEVVSTGLRIFGRPNIWGLESWREGLFEVQDEASQLVTQAVDARPGELVVDLCAGSGGKTLALAAQMQGQGWLLAVEPQAARLRDLEVRLKRAEGLGAWKEARKQARKEARSTAREPREHRELSHDRPLDMKLAANVEAGRLSLEIQKDQPEEESVSCRGSGVGSGSAAAQVSGPVVADLGSSWRGNVEWIEADARDSALISRLENRVDRVLVDAPCSGLGILRRGTDNRYRVSSEDPRRFAALQLELLQVAWRLLRPGGRLVYATCSVDVEENEDVALAFERELGCVPVSDSLHAAPGVDLLASSLNLAELEGFERLEGCESRQNLDGPGSLENGESHGRIESFENLENLENPARLETSKSLENSKSLEKPGSLENSESPESLRSSVGSEGLGNPAARALLDGEIGAKDGQPAAEIEKVSGSVGLRRLAFRRTWPDVEGCDGFFIASWQGLK